MRATTIILCDHDTVSVSRFIRDAKLMRVTVYAEPPEKVVKVAETTSPDLVLLDVHNRIDGRVLLARLKRNPSTNHIPVMMISDSEDTLTRQICLNLGAIDFLIKPISMQSFEKLIRFFKETQSVA